MTTLTEAQWMDLIVRCLHDLVDQRGNAPTGAGLSSEVLRVAKVENHAPPATLARKKFSKILTKLEAAGRLVKLEVPGADLLVAPADRPALLAEGASSARQAKPGIRRDLFAALTFVSDKLFYYDPASDAVIGMLAGDVAPDGAIPLPPTSFEVLVARAAPFAENQSGAARDALLASLTTSTPIADFLRVVNEQRLRPQWHDFRTQQLTEVLRSWAAGNNIPFQSTWLTSTADGTTSDERVAIGSEMSDRQRRFASELLLSALSEDDIKRVSVPLDVVLKLIGVTRK